jgi:hypothetical protein
MQGRVALPNSAGVGAGALISPTARALPRSRCKHLLRLLGEKINAGCRNKRN